MNGEKPARGWVLFDGECRLCLGAARRFARLLRRHGFEPAALQAPWVRARPGLTSEGEPAEMVVLTTSGAIFGGADGIVEIARRIWWAWPLFAAAQMPGMAPLLRMAYRQLAARRHCFDGACQTTKQSRWSDGLPLLLLPLLAMFTRGILPAWGFMWLFAFSLYFGCKWLTWRRVLRRNPRAGRWISMGYLLAWVGTDAGEFMRGRRKIAGLNRSNAIAMGSTRGPRVVFGGPPKSSSTPFAPTKRCASKWVDEVFGEPPNTAGQRPALPKPTASFRLSAGEWIWPVARILLGVTLIWLVVRLFCGAHPLAAGWIGMIGLILCLHFGLFHLLALGWQRVGVNARPIMRQPSRAVSLAEFWGRRWNVAFNSLAHDLVFRPMLRRVGTAGATVASFLVSGLVHELLISLPARGGYGLPTMYFAIQGLGVIFERTSFAKRLGLGRGWRGWLFTMTCAAGPVFWLFHPIFVHNVILPMLRAIGAT